MHVIPLPEAFKEEELEKNSSVFTIEPLYPGYGRTIGNALRRVLLSSLSGAAIVAVKIEGVQHEFSTIPHVKEDVVEIILNLKGVRIKAAPEVMEREDPVVLRLQAEGSVKVTAGDFEKESGIEILNPKHHLVTLTDDAASLNIEAYIGFGKGYDAVESRPEKRDKEIGLIEIDALYSPVVKVGYELENVRVGQMTNWDRLKVMVDTDGSISPKEALSEASRILVEHFQAVQAFPENADTADSDSESEGEEQEEQGETEERNASEEVGASQEGEVPSGDEEEKKES